MKISDIIIAVEIATGVKFDAMNKVNEFGKLSRKREIIFARHWIYYFARLETSLSLKEIAQTFRNQDHTTVIHGARHMDNLLYLREFREIRNKIKSELGLFAAPSDKPQEQEIMSLITLENELQKCLRAV